MAQNISYQLYEAVNADVTWRLNEFYDALDALKNAGINIYFDEDDNWASFTTNNRSSIYIWKKYPVIFCDIAVSPKIHNTLEGINYIQIISVKDTSKTLITFSEHLKIDYFDAGYLELPATVVDVWFNTVSN